MNAPARLTWPDIRARATAFARDWADGTSERADAQTFWNEFLAVFGVHRRRAQMVFERAAARFGRPGMGRIDVFWPGLLLAEHKSAGADLTAAYTQATDYFAGIPDPELPRYVVVSDFARIRCATCCASFRTSMAACSRNAWTLPSSPPTRAACCWTAAASSGRPFRRPSSAPYSRR